MENLDELDRLIETSNARRRYARQTRGWRRVEQRAREMRQRNRKNIACRIAALRRSGHHIPEDIDITEYFVRDSE